MNRHIKLFIKEFIDRLRRDNPRFFKIIQAISLIVASISSAIEILKDLPLNLPSWLQAMGSLNAAIVAMAAIILAQLPDKS